MNFMPLNQYPVEGSIIGRLLTGYVDLELDLCHCVSAAVDNFDTVFKAMFKDRGEARRIKEAEQLGKAAISRFGLSGDFDNAIDAMRYCLLIRNQYSHHIFWHDHSGQLAIANLEDIAKTNTVTGLESLASHHVSTALLQKQEQYFKYADVLLGWINFECRLKRSEIAVNPIPKPNSLVKPVLHLP
jgi:hypothetical protein